MPQNPLTGIGSRRAAITHCCQYVALGLVWIWLSDWALNLIGFAADGAFLAGAVKGTAFVVFTAGLLYGLVRGKSQQLRNPSDFCVPWLTHLGCRIRQGQERTSAAGEQSGAAVHGKNRTGSHRTQGFRVS